MKIAFFEVKEEWEKKILKSEFKDYEIKIFEGTLQDTDLKNFSNVDTICVFIYSICNEKILSKLPNLKNIATRSTGYDHIDIEFCKRKNITVSNVPSYGEQTVAEFTMALLLSISRKLIQSNQRVKSGLFDFTGLRGFDLKGKKIGLIGFGKIGQKFAKMCTAFDMEIVAYDKYRANYENYAKKLGVKFVSLSELFRASHIISIHVPLLPSTKHLLNAKSFSKMKNGVVILNTSRGDIINSRDLLDALNTGKVSFAGLDVLEGETLIKDETELLSSIPNFNKTTMKLILEDHILMNHNKVIMTPHNAFNTIDALKRILCTSVLNIKLIILKKKRENIIV